MGDLSLRALFRNESWMFCAGLVSIDWYNTATDGIFQPISTRTLDLDATYAVPGSQFSVLSSEYSSRTSQMNIGLRESLLPTGVTFFANLGLQIWSCFLSGPPTPLLE